MEKSLVSTMHILREKNRQNSAFLVTKNILQFVRLSVTERKTDLQDVCVCDKNLCNEKTN